MNKQQIFGPNNELPSLPDLQSNCEEELYLLMREIDLEFDRRNKSLHQEVSRLQTLCQAQQVELKKAQSTLLSSQEARKKNVCDQRDILLKELEKLKEENASLKKSNGYLQGKAERGNKCEYELEVLKRNFLSKENEITVLKNRLMKLDGKYKSLQTNYEKLMSLSTLKQPSKIADDKQGSSIKDLIIHNTEKYLQEENDKLEELQLRLTTQINTLDKRLNEEIM